MPFFPENRIKFRRSPISKNPLASGITNETEVVDGKSMKDHLRFAAATGTPSAAWAAIPSARLCQTSLGGRHRFRRDGHQAGPGRF